MLSLITNLKKKPSQQVKTDEISTTLERYWWFAVVLQPGTRITTLHSSHNFALVQHEKMHSFSADQKRVILQSMCLEQVQYTFSLVY